MGGFIAKNGKKNCSLKTCDVGLIPEDDLWHIFELLELVNLWIRNLVKFNI